jgi:hypothetical protein
MATATPSAKPRAQTAQKQHAGLLELDPQPSVARIRLCEGAAPTVSAPLQVPELASQRLRGIGPEPETWKKPDPRRRSSRGSGTQNRPACTAIVATRRPRPVPSQRFLALWCQAQTPSCSRKVTSTSIRTIKPGPASNPLGHAPLRTDTLSLARTISDRRLFTIVIGDEFLIVAHTDHSHLGVARSASVFQARLQSRWSSGTRQSRESRLWPAVS